MNEVLLSPRGDLKELPSSLRSYWFVWPAFLVAWGILSILLIFIAGRLDAGMDISDTAFYLISQAWHAQIRAQITLFGPLWDSISPFGSIYWNRVLALALIAISSIYFASGAAAYFAEMAIRRAAGLVVPLAVSGALTFYSFWLPDASYDLMNLILISAALGSFFRLLTLFRAPRLISAGEVVLPIAILGAVGSGLAVVKITTAALLAPVIVIYLLWSGWRIGNRKIWVSAIGAALFGMLVTALLLAAVGLSPSKAMSVLVEGYHVARMITDPHFDVLRSITMHLSNIQYAISVNRQLTVLLVMLFVLSVVKAPNTKIVATIRPWIRIGQWMILIAIMIVLARDTTSPQVRLSLIGLLSQLSAIYSVSIGEFKGKLRRRALTIIGITLYAQIAYCFGTNSSWSTLISLSTLLALLPAIILYGSSIGPQVVSVLILVGGAALVTMGAIERNPYRMESSFSALTETVTVGPYDEPFKVNLALVPFFRNLANVHDGYFNHGDVPVLLDLTGRAPMAVYQLGARLPGTAWTLTGYPGSSDFFLYFVSRLSEADRNSAWLLIPDDAHPGIPLNLLAAVGIRFPGNYVPITTVPIPYINAQATLYRPVAQPGLVP